MKVAFCKRIVSSSGHFLSMENKVIALSTEFQKIARFDLRRIS